MFPQCSTSRAAVGLGILLNIFDTGKVILEQVEVKSTQVVAKGAVNQLCSNVWYCIFFFSIVFISLLSIGWVQGNRRKCSPHRGVSDQAVLSASHQKTYFSQGKILYITHSNAVHPSLNSLGDNRCGVPKPEKSTNCRCRLFHYCVCNRRQPNHGSQPDRKASKYLSL